MAPLGEKVNIFNQIDIYSHFLPKITNNLVNFLFTIQIAYFNEKKIIFLILYLTKVIILNISSKIHWENYFVW